MKRSDHSPTREVAAHSQWHVSTDAIFKQNPDMFAMWLEEVMRVMTGSSQQTG